MKNILLIICCLILCATSATPDSQQSLAVDTVNQKETVKPTGPTVHLDLDTGQTKANPASAFMYFVPMISRATLECKMSQNNTQTTCITSYKRKVKAQSFNAVCEFTINGQGYHTNKFEPKEIIKLVSEETKRGKTLKNAIEYIEFKSPGCGRIEIEGTIIKGVEKVTDVKVVFNNKSKASPVTIGLYNVPFVKDEYKYNNRTSEIRARVNSISFKNVQTKPRMDIELATLRNKNAGEGLLASFKGKIANLFIKPILINEKGNQAMLNFGYALYAKKASFTFPIAENLKDNKKKDQETVVARADSSRKEPNAQAN